MDALKALSVLRDVEGVYGSFVVDSDGVPQFRDLPTIISNSALAEAGPRIARLWLSLPPEDTPSHLELHFSAHKLYIRKFVGGTLCVFAPPRVHHIALSVPVGIVVEALQDALQSSEASAELSVEAPASDSQTPDESAPPSSRTIVYRGRQYTV